MIRYLAIDPSSRISGYAIFDYQERDCKLLQHGIVATNKLAYAHRFYQMDWWLEQLFEQWHFSEVCYESAHGQYRIHSLLAAIQVITEFCKRHKIKSTGYSPTAIKRAVAGNGRATKEEVALGVRLVWGLNDLSDHEYDAIAVGQLHGGWLQVNDMADPST